MVDDIAEAPPTIPIYRDPSHTYAHTPPTGRLDGWEVRRIPEQLWDDYEDACRTTNHLARQLEQAVSRRDTLRQRLVQAWERQ